MSYRAPVEDILATMRHVAGLDRLIADGLAPELDGDMTQAVLDEAAKFAADVIAPLNRIGDKHGSTLKDGAVTTPPGWKEAYTAWAQAGWNALPAPEEHGGQGLPALLQSACTEMWNSAAFAFALGPLLTVGAIEALHAHGSEHLKETYLARLVSGEWMGTMNLTEPQAGSDLNALRTKAEPAADGTYRITGQKIFITYGEHDLTENIVHLVLARLPDAPAGTRGISLFLVPKYLVNADGSLGEHNDLRCSGIEHKLGIHASPTCSMAFGDKGGAIGWLIGEENRGLACMFTMMNNARLNVALQGVAIAERAYQQALGFARERRQGVALDAPKGSAMSPIIVHPDIRRSLMTIRAFNEAGRAFLLWTALKSDIAHRSADEKERQTADDILGLVTPILKGVMTDKGFDHAVMAQQVFGGHGYIEEHGMSQYVRDARIAMIYEGANGIQALDLVGRKLGQNGGRAVMALFKEIGDFCEENRSDEQMAFFTKNLKKGLNDVQASTMWFMQHAMAKPDNAGAGSTDYMHLFGLVILGYMWAKMAKAAEDGLASGETDREAFLRNKLITARFFMERIMPETALRKARIETGAETMMALSADAF